ncbi:porin [Uliginosibacterium paludis]|uniref:Porin n=1 Tax=Uliginosibacterium paludis TaxID=1615952 RepID=A0ABV2CTH8_9RHOO
MMKQHGAFASTPIALALAALLSTAAQAQEVKLGGKFDAGYQFKHTAAADSSNGARNGTATTETLGDGGASTSRITIDAKEQIGSSLEAYVSHDLRFGNVQEGTSGISNNDKKVMGLRTPVGDFAWGTYNITNLVIAEKPYMTNIKDMEIVKFGISKLTQSDLTSRNTEYVTPILTIGPANMLLKGNYAFGDNRKSGASDDQSVTATQSSGDAWSAGYEMVLGAVKDRKLTLSSVVTRRTPSSNVAQDGYMSWDTGLTWRPDFLDGLKFSASYFAAKGYVSGPDTAYQYKNTNFVVAYNYAKLWQVGVGISHANDVGSNRNSGRNIMVGGAYWLSPNVYLYGAAYQQDFERNESISGAKYDGTKTGFKDSLKKLDENYYRFGIVKEF